MYDWNDLRHFLAVARTGSTLAASRALGVNQTTTARRVAALESTLGVKLFEKQLVGYLLTEAGEELRSAALRVEAEAVAFASQAGAMERRISGVIRVTTNEGLANTVMAPALSAFRRLYPQVRVDLIVDERRLDLVRGAVDVALRSGSRPADAGLVGRRLPDIAWAAYCSRDYAERNGCPDSLESLNRHALIGAEGPIEALGGWKWLSQAAPRAEVAARSSSVTNLLSAVKAGLGISVLPCMLGDAEPTLIRCIGPIENLKSEVWLLTRDDRRDVARVRAFVEFLAKHVGGMRRLLTGETLPPQGEHPEARLTERS